MKFHTLGILLLLAIQLYLTTALGCPNNCSGNGFCNPLSDKCICDSGWKGEDCSISTVTLTKGVRHSTSVDRLGWKFFEYTVPAGKSHRITMTNGKNQDPDLFLRRNVLPTRTAYDYTHMGIGNVSHITVPKQPEATLWIAGVYGFTQADIEIWFEEYNTNCPLDCSNRGTCLPNNTCQCPKGWGDSACSTPIDPSPILTWTNPKRLDKSEWLYAYFEIPENTPAFRLVSEELDNTSDVDIYIKKGELPSFAHWDYANRSLSSESWIVVANPPTGVYYIGFYGYRESNFRWKLIIETPNNDCPGRCSEHGECRNGACHCDQHYNGANCEDRVTDLQQNENVTGYVAERLFNYYHFTTRSSNNLVIYVSHDDGDCDLYIHQNSIVPTRFNYLYSHLSLEKNFNLTIPNPGNNRWNIGVYGYRPCRYSIRALVSSDGCPQCVHGRCVDGQTRCICDEGWGGDDCSIQVVDIRGNQKISGSVRPNEWKYYKFTGSASAFHIVLNDERGVNWLFVSVMSTPTLNRFDFSDTKLFSKTHRISVEIGEFIPETSFYIGVYGSPYSIGDTEFELITWAAPFK